jgi:HSP20 family protein
MPNMIGPTLEIARIQSEINRLFESLLEIKQLGESAEPMWMPNTDILDGPETLTLMIELPGVSAADLELKADGGNIMVSGEKRSRPLDGEVTQHHCLERSYGRFSRTIALNYAINTHKADARLRDGVLKIVFPKVENRRGGAVPIPIKEA